MVCWTDSTSSFVKTNAIMTADDCHIYKSDVCRLWSDCSVIFVMTLRLYAIWIKMQTAGIMQYKDEKLCCCWVCSKTGKAEDLFPMQSSMEVLWIMQWARGLGDGGRMPVWALNIEYLTSEWTWTDCRSLLWQTHPSLDCACRPGREPAILILTRQCGLKNSSVYT